jgi:RNA polymerase sigma-70 factor (ECF subfamily)
MSDVTESIDRLLDEWQAGINREEHFRRLFERYYRPLYRFFEKRGFTAAECHDLTQETFLRVYKGMESFRREAPFEAWLYQIAANTYCKSLRWQATQKRAAQHVPLESAMAETQGPPHQSAPLAPGPLEDVLEKERLHLLRAAVEELPEQMRKCVLLRVYQELSYQEIAVVMRLSVETVKAHLYQARQRLKAKLGDYFS